MSGPLQLVPFVTISPLAAIGTEADFVLQLELLPDRATQTLTLSTF